MKLTADKNEFAHAFLQAADFAPGRSATKELTSILLTATKDALSFTATDYEVGIKVELKDKSQVTKEGNCLLNRDALTEILKNSSAEELSIIATARGINLEIGRSTYKLQTERPDDFPAVTIPAVRDYHTFAAADLCRVFKRTMFATDETSTRYALGGIRFELSDNCFAAGTDGRRLAAMQFKATPSKEGYSSESILPTRAAKLFAKTLAGMGDVRFAPSGNDIAVAAEGLTLYARQVEGRFPKWREIIPSKATCRIELTAGTLQSAVKQAAIVLSDESRGLDFLFGDGQLQLLAKTGDGEAIVEVPIAYDGSPLTVTLDNRYVLDFLKAIDSESSTAIDLIDENSAVVLSSGDEYHYVVMPLSRDR